jgi:general nucleoside transport system ATP-binding protein
LLADARPRRLRGRGHPRDRGAAVFVISEDLEELLAISDAIAVIFSGRIVGSMPRETATVPRLGALMSGLDAP